MGNKSKVLLYPYDRSSFSIVMYLQSMESEYELKHLVSTKSISIGNCDAGECYELPEVGIPIEDDFENALADVDTVIIVESKMNKRLKKIIEQNILTALKSNKYVVNCACLDNDFFIECKRNPFFRDISRTEDVGQYTQNLTEDELYRIKAPVILIGELVDGLESYDILTYMVSFFRKKGYRIAAIGEKEYSPILEIERFPDFIMDNNMDPQKKIFLFNSFIQEMDKNQKPDIIFVEMPGGIMKYNNMFTNSFGILPYLVSQAIEPDYAILNVPYDIINSSFFDTLAQICEYHLGVELFGVCMSNSMIAIQDSKQARKIQYLHLSQKQLNDNIRIHFANSNVSVFNCYYEEDNKKMCEGLIELLS